MIDPLLDFYQRELSFIREMGADFATKHPKIAGRLRLDADSIEDPHVSRLIEAFALLTARIRLKIEDEFPEICQAMLQALYPQYLAPTPPVSICQFRLSDQSKENPNGMMLARGSRLETESIDGQSCRFRTCYETRLFPIEISQADYLQPPLPMATSPWNNDVQAAIRLRLTSSSDKLPLDKINIDQLRFFLGGSTACSNQLVEALVGDCLGVAVIGNSTNQAEFLPTSSIEPVGYESDESLVDNDPRVLSAYRILWEFFAASSKFRFVDVNLAAHWKKTKETKSADLVFYLKRFHPVLQREFGRETMRLGCSPIVNLFFQRSEPIRLTETNTEYRVIPSARSPRSMEVYSIGRVSAIDPSGRETEFQPFFWPSHGSRENAVSRFWYATRRPAAGENVEGDRGTELFITLVDLQGRPLPAEKWTLDVETLCLNRDMVAKLPYGGGQPIIKLLEGSGAVTANLVTPATPTLRTVSNDDIHWRLISHLSLHHLTLTDADSGAESLREILRLYNSTDDPETRKAVESILNVRYQKGVARVKGGQGPGFCRGLDIELTVDEERLVGTGSYLFTMILDRFFGLYANLNSFTRLTVRRQGKVEPLFVGHARMGNQPLL